MLEVKHIYNISIYFYLFFEICFNSNSFILYFYKIGSNINLRTFTEPLFVSDSIFSNKSRMCIILGCIHWTLYICYLLIFLGSSWIQHLLYSISFELSRYLYLWIHIFGIVPHRVFCISASFQTWYFYLSILLDQLILVAFLISYIWLPPFFFYVTHLI